MRLYDVSQEVFSSAVYPGDPTPRYERLATYEKEGYLLTAFSMCAHNGTHIDAPAHFIEGGKTVEQLAPEALVGECCVQKAEGDLDGAAMQGILEKAKPQGGKLRLLLKGNCALSEEAARMAADACLLVGVEGQSVAAATVTASVHRILLGAECLCLEGLRLGEVREGRYLLFAAPLLLGGADGAPVRAMLAELP